MNFRNVRVQASCIKGSNDYLYIFNESIYGVVGKNARILAIVIFIVYISFQSVSYVFFKIVKWQATT